MKNFTKTFYLILPFLFFQNLTSAQDLSGTWNGRFSLKGSPRNWSFEIDLEQDHSSIKGVGKQIELSRKDQSRNINSTFTIGGNFDGQQLEYNMQEVLFLKSPNGQCLAKCRYDFRETFSKYQFVGECNRNGTFFRKNKYFPDHLACQDPATTQVIFEKTKDLRNRKTAIVETVRIKNSKVIIKIWDNDKVDGDIISLNFNGHWILQNYRVTKHVKVLMFDLPEASNELILYAENLGTMPPNTAAISIWNGKEEIRSLTLNSDESLSQGVRILREE